MSIIDVGKDAKRAGRTKPSVARKLDPVPEKHPPGVAKPHANSEKPFGISYEYKTYRFVDGLLKVEWVPRAMWFKRAAHRDQSLEAMARRPVTWRRHPTKVTR